jgi:hypothetical protein
MIECGEGTAIAGGDGSVCGELGGRAEPVVVAQRYVVDVELRELRSGEAQRISARPMGSIAYGSVQQGNVRALRLPSAEPGERVRFVREVVGKAVYVQGPGLRLDTHRIAWIGSAEDVSGRGEVSIGAGNDQWVVVARHHEYGRHYLEQAAEDLPRLGRDPFCGPGTVEQVARHHHRVDLVFSRDLRKVAECAEHGLRPLRSVRTERRDRGAKVYVGKVQDTHYASYHNDWRRQG